MEHGSPLVVVCEDAIEHRHVKMYIQVDARSESLHVSHGAAARPALPPRALALERRAPQAGLIFGPYQRALREPLKAAARAAGLDERRASKISVYDLRHAAAKRYLDASGNQRGVSFLLGQTQPTTLNRYTRPDELAAHDVLTKALAAPGASASTDALADGRQTERAGAHHALDALQPLDYTVVPLREGGGIGRRTSLRC